MTRQIAPRVPGDGGGDPVVPAPDPSGTTRYSRLGTVPSGPACPAPVPTTSGGILRLQSTRPGGGVQPGSRAVAVHNEVTGTSAGRRVNGAARAAQAGGQRQRGQQPSAGQVDALDSGGLVVAVRSGTAHVLGVAVVVGVQHVPDDGLAGPRPQRHLPPDRAGDRVDVLDLRVQPTRATSRAVTGSTVTLPVPLAWSDEGIWRGGLAAPVAAFSSHHVRASGSYAVIRPLTSVSVGVSWLPGRGNWAPRGRVRRVAHCRLPVTLIDRLDHRAARPARTPPD